MLLFGSQRGRTSLALPGFRGRCMRECICARTCVGFLVETERRVGDVRFVVAPSSQLHVEVESELGAVVAPSVVRATRQRTCREVKSVTRDPGALYSKFLCATEAETFSRKITYTKGDAKSISWHNSLRPSGHERADSFPFLSVQEELSKSIQNQWFSVHNCVYTCSCHGQNLFSDMNFTPKQSTRVCVQEPKFRAAADLTLVEVAPRSAVLLRQGRRHVGLLLEPESLQNLPLNHNQPHVFVPEMTTGNTECVCACSPVYEVSGRLCVQERSRWS